MTSPTTWATLLRAYQLHQQAAGLSRGTIRLHAYRLADLAALVAVPALVTAEVLLGVLANPRWAPETRKSVRSVYRSFFRWAQRAGRLARNPAADLPPIRVPRAVPRPAPEHVFRESLRDASPREAMMLRLAGRAGLRCCEIAPVHASDWDGLRLRVLGKGGKTRLVPIVDVELRADLDGLRGYAFPNRWTGEPITAGYVSRLLSRALAETWTGHTLRHRFGTRACSVTKDIAAVAEVMGHERIETTRGYTRIEDDRLVAVAAAAS